MKQVLQLAAFTGVLAAVDAKVLKWQRDEPSWSPAKETAAAMYRDDGWSPAPTSAPQVDVELLKRANGDNTCGYISGVSTDSIYCDLDDFCAVNTFYSFAGCCGSSTSAECKVATTCLPSSRSPVGSDPLTFWCGSAASPSCVTYVYAGTGEFGGYTLYNCGPSAERVTVYYDPIADATASQTTQTSGASSTSLTGPAATTKSASSSSAPVGAIVGGVVGGIAALVLLGMGIFFLVRQSKKNTNYTAPMAQYDPTQLAPPPQPGPPGGGMYPAQQQVPPMQENLPPQGYPPPPGYPPQGYPPQGYPPQGYPPQGYPTSFAAPPIDNRSSMAKPPYDVSHTPNETSPPGSPPPASPYSTLGPTSQPAPPPTQYSPQPAGQPQFSAPQGGPHVVELPTQRGDAELREMA